MKQELTGRENVRAMLQGHSPERLVWAPCIDAYCRAGLPEPLRSLDLFELQRRFGLDLFRGAWPCGERFEGVHHQRTEHDDGRVVDVYETPHGTLTEEHTYVPESPNIPFPTEYLIKSYDDLDRYLYVVEHTVVTEEHEQHRRLIETYPDIMVSAGVTDTPLPALLTKLIGIENFVQMYYDAPERMEHAMHVMQAKHKKLVEAAVRGPGEVFICYENTNTRVFGLDWVEQYELPFLNDYADIAHAHGKYLLVHMCGHIRQILEQLSGARFDGVIDVAPPPTGDCELPDAVAALGPAGKVVGGGIECNTFLLADTDEFERAVEALVARVELPSRFLLGSGDAVPCGATEANLVRAERVAKRTRFV